MEQEQNSKAWIWIVVAIIVIVALFFIFRPKTPAVEVTGNETSTSTSPTSSLAIRPYGEVELKLGETANFNGISITPLSIVEDSRCPSDVQCIQAGTVRVNVKSLQNGGITKESIVGLNVPAKIDTFTVALVTVTPGTKAGSKISDSDYRLRFRVNQAAVVDTGLIGK